MTRDSRENHLTNRWWWEGYDAREQGKPYAILTTSSEWRQGWTTRDQEISRNIAYKAAY